jgi:putative serine protease PepD
LAGRDGPTLGTVRAGNDPILQERAIMSDDQSNKPGSSEPAPEPTRGLSQNETSPIPSLSENETQVHQPANDPSYQGYVGQNPAYDQQAYEQAYREWYAQYGSPEPVQSGGQLPPPPLALSDVGATPKAGGGVSKPIMAGIAAGLVAGLLAGAGGFLIADQVNGSSIVSSGENQFNPANPEELSPRAQNSIAAIADKMLPTVVSILVKGSGEAGTGSGVIIRADGYILTNNHVVSVAAGAGGGSVTVQFDNDETLPAKIVGRSTSYDLAVLKVDKSGLAAAQLGNSQSVKVGDAAVAIGSPLGLNGTVTSGIVSALDRPVTTGGDSESSFISAIQTDAPINPGNSGGPLVNSEAQVIGINTAIATLGGSQEGQSGSIGLGFAIPINTGKRIADEIISTGRARVPILGVNVDLQYQGDGARVNSIVAGGAAAKAGVKSGDVITAVDGNQLSSSSELLSVLRSKAPGDTVKLTVQDPGGGTHDVTVTLGAKIG